MQSLSPLPDVGDSPHDSEELQVLILDHYRVPQIIDVGSAYTKS